MRRILVIVCLLLLLTGCAAGSGGDVVSITREDRRDFETTAAATETPETKPQQEETVLPAFPEVTSEQAVETEVDYTYLPLLDSFFASDMYQASKEWRRFYLNNLQTGIADPELPPPYTSYGAENREMAEKIDELCENYSLSLIYDCVFDLDADAFYGPVYRVPVHCKTQNGVEIETLSHNYYADGGYDFEGVAHIRGEDTLWNYVLNFRFYCFRADRFYDELQLLLPQREYRQWSYITQNGVETVLFADEEYAYILAQRGDCWYLVQVLNPGVAASASGGTSMSEADLTAFAEVFDFTLVLK